RRRCSNFVPRISAIWRIARRFRSAGRNRLPGGAALRDVGVIPRRVLAVIPVLRRIGLAVIVGAVIGIVLAVVEPAIPAPAAAEPAAAEPAPVEPAAVEAAAMEAAAAEAATMHPAAPAVTTATT